ncbi:MAG: hypothetical protein KGM24_01205, partial [Elusimicrobia bacterium]|nr:hypothetical protein [Elusimicrobiota bacterium]
PLAVREREREILLRRARLPDPPVEPARPSWAIRPDDGHGRQRWRIGGGARSRAGGRGGSFVELGWRPGYHSLADRSQGFLPGAAIQGFSARLRWDEAERRLTVRDLRLAEILSAAPWDSWTRRPSWGLGTGLAPAYELGKPPSESLVYDAHFAAGLSAAPWDGALVYALAGPEGAVGSPLRDGWRAGGDVRAGFAVGLTPRWRVAGEGALAGMLLGDRTPAPRARLDVNWAPARDFALRAEGFWRGHYREAGLYALFYR